MPLNSRKRFKSGRNYNATYGSIGGLILLIAVALLRGRGPALGMPRSIRRSSGAGRRARGAAESVVAPLATLRRDA